MATEDQGSRERGFAFLRDTLGEQAELQMRDAVDAGGLNATLGSIAVDLAFGTVWCRPGLDRAKRSLVNIGIMVATRQYAELKNHLRIALANGLTPIELEEAVVQCVPYCGLPSAANAAAMLTEVLREAGIETDQKTAQERGLL